MFSPQAPPLPDRAEPLPPGTSCVGERSFTAPVPPAPEAPNASPKQPQSAAAPPPPGTARTHDLHHAVLRPPPARINTRHKLSRAISAGSQLRWQADPAPRRRGGATSPNASTSPGHAAPVHFFRAEPSPSSSIGPHALPGDDLAHHYAERPPKTRTCSIPGLAIPPRRRLLWPAQLPKPPPQPPAAEAEAHVEAEGEPAARTAASTRTPTKAANPNQRPIPRRPQEKSRTRPHQQRCQNELSTQDRQ